MLLFIHGDNQYASLNRLKQVRESYKGSSIVIDGDTIDDPVRIFSSTDSISMFTPKLLTVVKRFQNNPKKISLGTRIVERLQGKGFADIDLIFWEDHNTEANKYSYKPKKPVTAKKKQVTTAKPLSLSKYLLENAKVETFAPLNTPQLQQWLQTGLSNLGIANGSLFVNRILARCGSDQLILESELQKLGLYLKARGQTKLELLDLDILTPYEQEVKIWDLTDAVCSRNKTRTLELLDSLITGPESYPLIFSAILKQLKQIYLAQKFARDRERFMKVLALKPYTYSKLVSFARGFTATQIKTLYSKLVNLDFAVKQSKINVELGLDLLIATL